MGFINSELDELQCPEQIRAKIKLAVDELSEIYVIMLMIPPRAPSRYVWKANRIHWLLKYPL